MAGVLAGLLSMMAVAVPASAAHADQGWGCPGPITSNYDPGAGYVRYQSVAVRGSDSGDCPADYHVGPSQLLYYWCFAVNSYGHRWTFVRITGTQKTGWVYSGSIKGGGSTYEC